MQSDLFHCKVTVHVSGVTAPLISSTKNCNRNLRYRSQYQYSYFPPDLTTLEGSSCTDTEWPKKMYTLFTHQYLWNKFK